jgi:hypothetical protein
LVNESIWLPYRTPGAALPGRKVMTLVHGMLAGADSIDDMNLLRAGPVHVKTSSPVGSMCGVAFLSWRRVESCS